MTKEVESKDPAPDGSEAAAPGKATAPVSEPPAAGLKAETKEDPKDGKKKNDKEDNGQLATKPIADRSGDEDEDAGSEEGNAEDGDLDESKRCVTRNMSWR